MRALGITLLVGALLTLGWLFLCPTYQISGPPSTFAMVANGYGNSGTHSVPYQHLDAVTFFGVDIVLWAATAGCCLLRSDLARIFGPVLEKPLIEPEAPRKTANAPPVDW